MARVRLTFRTLTLFEDEEAGDTHMALYAAVRDGVGNELGAFRWNNLNQKVNEVTTYSLANDRANPNVVEVDVGSPVSIAVSAFADDDQDWPTAQSNENDLGGATADLDPQIASTLGSLTLGPTRTDNGNVGYAVNVDAQIVAEPAPADLRIQFRDLILYEDEEAGSTHMAISVFADAPPRDGLPGVNQLIFSWNNANDEVNEVNDYDLNNGQVPSTIRLSVPGPTFISVEGYADDDQNWPWRNSFENFLGQAVLFVDPADPSTLGQRQLGPTTTDNGNTGYVINLVVDVLPKDRPSLLIAGVEATQAIQHYNTYLGPTNSLPLIAHRATLVRVYVDSGLDPSAQGGGLVANVTGTLTVTGASNLTLPPLAPLTAKPLSRLDPQTFTDTLNFLIPPDSVGGSLAFTVEVRGPGSPAPRAQVGPFSFHRVPPIHILIFRIQSGPVSGEDSSGGPPSRATYFRAVNQLPLIYPIPSDPGESIVYWYVPGAESISTRHDLKTQDGMSDLLDDLEDIQEDGPDWIKGYGLVQNNLLARFGLARKWDNVAIGYAFIMESVGHEIAHLFGLQHAPCGNPANVDDDFVPINGLIGEVGVDPSGGVAFGPGTSDFMSYCGDRGATRYENQWISAYHWKKLLSELTG